MKIEQHFVKNNDFKTIKADGVFGGVTQFGDINFVVFTDRLPIPKSISIEINDNNLGIVQELSRETKEGIIKEVQFGIKMDLGVAKQTVQWLQEKIDQLEEALKESKNG